MKIKTTNIALDRIVEACEEVEARGEPLIMGTIIRAFGSNPQEVGARILVFRNGEIRGTVGGGKVEAEVIKDAQKMLEEGQDFQIKRYNLLQIGMTCGGSMEIFLERIDISPQLFIFGGGHVAAPTAEFAAKVGFNVTVIDERTDWANKERFPLATIVNKTFPEFLETFEPKEQHYILLLSSGHQEDQEVLEHVLEGPQRYLGMIGSRRKAKTMHDALMAKGFSEEAWQRLHCPVGIPLGESKPAEIAISIVAQLIQVRYQKEH